MEFRKILWSILKTIFRLIWKLFLLCLWGCAEFLAVAFRSLSASLKNHITKSKT